MRPFTYFIHKMVGLVMYLVIFDSLQYFYPHAQGNVIGSVRIYIHMCTKKIVIERTRDLIYLKFVATDFFPKTPVT